MYKKLPLILCSSTLLFTSLLGTVAPKASAYENDVIYNNVESIENIAINLNDTIPHTEFSEEGYRLYLEDKENTPKISTRGWKKDGVVLALRYGGDMLGSILGMLSDKNGKLVKKHSGKLADALDRFENSIEANMIQFMNQELGFPISASRSIAWAICKFAL
ncbi:hypothetical protein [Lysinibacillus sp. NPDC056959]|uniref:hypothetical protein n=1 Tax=Lysinibacillus TaxID=400634 RepID=UPI0010642770